MKKFFGFLIILVLVGCGYKPSSQYTRDILGNSIYADVSISREDPKNSVLIKDAVNEAIITRLGSKLSPKEMAYTKLFVKIDSVSFSPILYDKDGYVISYKATVSLDIRYSNEDIMNDFSTSGEYDFPIEPNSIISDSKRFEAIKFASLDALNEFISKIAIIGMQKKE